MINLAINGFGRIGRASFKKIIQSHPGIAIVAVNDLADIETLAHLLRYDSVYGRYPIEVSIKDNCFLVKDQKIEVLSQPDPEKLPWKKLEVDVVLECTGRFKERAQVEKHLKAGAKKVIISAPCKGDDIPSFVLGVNEKIFDPKKDHISDMGSCTTNCLAPIAKVLHENLGIVSGLMTTIHSYTNDQKLLDLPHRDLRRARAAGLNIVPTTTGATKAIGKVIPEIEGKLDGIAVRVPSPVVSLLDLICHVEKQTDSKQVNNFFRQAAEKELKGILRVEDQPLVSVDFKGDEFSAIVDAGLTRVIGKTVKVVGWYDNEWAYACRLADFAEYVTQKS